MGRPAAGWKLRRKGGVLCVRFTAHGRQVERSTGESDASRASAVAARIYAAEIRTPSARRERAPLAPPDSILIAAENWLDAEEQLRDELTNETFARYAKALWQPHFGDVSALTLPEIERYRAVRLERVAATTVRKELVALRAFLHWLGSEVEVPSVPRRATGKPVEWHWKGSQELSPDEVEAVLAALTSPARERYTVAYETALRPSTIDALSVPEHYTKGATELRLTKQVDKARFGRALPLSERARAVLDAVAPEEGLIFGKRKYRKQVKNAGAAVLPKEKAKWLTPTDLRANRATHLLEAGASLPGVQYLAGHKQVATTSRYVKANMRAARDAIEKGER